MEGDIENKENNASAVKTQKSVSLSQASEIAEIIATIALVTTLIFVGLQVRQSGHQTQQANLIAQAQLSTTTTQYYQKFYQEAFATEEKIALLEKAMFTMEPLTPYEQMIFIRFMEDLVTMGSQSYQLHKQGLVTDVTYYGGTATAKGMMTLPRPRKWWSGYRNIMTWDPEYVAYMDKIFDQTKGTSPVNLRELMDVNTALDAKQAP